MPCSAPADGETALNAQPSGPKLFSAHFFQQTESVSTPASNAPLPFCGKVIAVDIETTGLNPLKEDIRLVSCVGDGDTRRVFQSPEPIKDILANPDILKVFHNAAFDVCFLEVKGYSVKNYTCTMMMAQVLDNNNGSHKLKDVVKQYLRKDLDKTYQDPAFWQGEVTEAHCEYAINDALVTYELYHVLEPRIIERNLQGVCQREIRALPALIHLYIDGFHFDCKSWSADLSGHERAKETLEAEIQALLVSDINLASPKQLLHCLQNRGYVGLKDTSDEILALIEDQVPELQLVITKLRAWRELQQTDYDLRANVVGCRRQRRPYSSEFQAHRHRDRSHVVPRPQPPAGAVGT